MLNVTALSAVIGANNRVEYRCIAHTDVGNSTLVLAGIKKETVVQSTVLSSTTFIDKNSANPCCGAGGWSGTFAAVGDAGFEIWAV
jgi:hypothetical protein